MILIRLRIAGWISKARISLGGELLLLGSRIHLGLGDLGMWIEPRLATGQRPDRRIRPWLGLLVIVLLIAGIALVSGGAVWAIREALPHREMRP